MLVHVIIYIDLKPVPTVQELCPFSVTDLDIFHHKRQYENVHPSQIIQNNCSSYDELKHQKRFYFKLNLTFKRVIWTSIGHYIKNISAQ